jgi:hypothetical protein
MFLGTNQNNIDDRERKGRGARFIGAAHPRAILTGKEVLEIRKSNESQIKLGRKYDVSPSLIGAIRNNRIWTHI